MTLVLTKEYYRVVIVFSSHHTTILVGNDSLSPLSQTLKENKKHFKVAEV